MSFQLLRPQSDKHEPRVGRLIFRGRNPIDTPHYLAATSRGAVPHLSQDMTRDNTSICALYTAVEDCEYLDSPADISSSTNGRALTGARKF